MPANGLIRATPGHYAGLLSLPMRQAEDICGGRCRPPDARQDRITLERLETSLYVLKNECECAGAIDWSSWRAGPETLSTFAPFVPQPGG